VDNQGEELQEEIRHVVRRQGCAFWTEHVRPSLHASEPCRQFFPLGKVSRGNISYIAQTGNFATHSMRYIMSAENYGVARVVGLGNKVDVEESEVLEYLGEDPETKAILLYLESFRRPRRFLEVARKVTHHKPVLLLKGGARRREPSPPSLTRQPWPLTIGL